MFVQGEGGYDIIHDFNMGGVNDEIVMVGFDNDEVSITDVGTNDALIKTVGSSQTILVKGGGGLGIDDIDFA